MSVVKQATDVTERLQGHTTHPAIVTVPLGAFVVSNVSDGLAMGTGEPRYDSASEVSLAVGLVGAVAAAATGLRDYAYIPSDRQPNHRIATTHGLGNSAVAGLYASSYFLRRADRLGGRPTRLAARLLGLAGGGLSLYTAWLGGKLVEEWARACIPCIPGSSTAMKRRSWGCESTGIVDALPRVGSV